MAVTTTSQAKTVVSLLKLVSSGTILLRRVMTESPWRLTLRSPQLISESLIWAHSRQSLLASPPITFARPAAVAELTLPSVSASLDHWQLPKRCRSKPPRIAFALVRGREDTYGQIGAQDEGIE